MEKFWNHIKEKLPQHLSKNVRLLTQNGRSNFSVVFPDRENAEEFINYCRDNEMFWTDPPDKEKKRINAKPDRSFEKRLMGQIYNCIWKQTETILTAKNKSMVYKLSTTGNRGHFTISADDDIWTLFSIKNLSAGDSSEIQIHHDSCAYWDITREEANRIISAAIKVVRRE